MCLHLFSAQPLLHLSSAPTVPGAVPSQSLRATPFEDRILLYWKEPTEPNGIIIQYEVLFANEEQEENCSVAVLALNSLQLVFVFFSLFFQQISYSGLRSFDPSVPLQRPGLMVSLPSNATHHLFSQLHPGVTYQLSIRASTSKGFGPATTLNVTTNISGEQPLFCNHVSLCQIVVRLGNSLKTCDSSAAPTIEEYDGSEAFLNETATTITVLLKPAQAKGAPIRYWKIHCTDQVEYFLPQSK